jgi:hypothetical protein
VYCDNAIVYRDHAIGEVAHFDIVCEPETLFAALRRRGLWPDAKQTQAEFMRAVSLPANSATGG